MRDFDKGAFMRAWDLVFKPTFWSLDCPHLELFPNEPTVQSCHVKT